VSRGSEGYDRRKTAAGDEEVFCDKAGGGHGRGGEDVKGGGARRAHGHGRRRGCGFGFRGATLSSHAPVPVSGTGT
jgi:hypothetical protein